MSEAAITVLLIEDNIPDTRLIRELLEEDKTIRFKIIHVTELEVGLDSLRMGDIHVVLLDLTLPDSQGMETFSRVYSRAPHVPIVVLTGVKDEGLALEVIRAGAQDFLVKGMINYCVLRQTVLYAIERKRGAPLESIGLCAPGIVVRGEDNQPVEPGDMGPGAAIDSLASPTGGST
jgi:DNA-binding NarL/FixJ family response regulator